MRASVLADLDTARTRDAAAALGAHPLAFDVADRGAVAAAHERLAEAGITIGLLVNSAGIVQPPEPPDRFAIGDFRRVVAIDFEGTYHCCAEFGSAMAQRGRGAIVNIASVAGMRSMPLQNDPLACRNCHQYGSMDFTRQSHRAQSMHSTYLSHKERTCIDGHKGIAHRLPHLPPGEAPTDTPGQTVPKPGVSTQAAVSATAAAGGTGR